MEPNVNTSAGKETASETIARIQAARAAAGNDPRTGAPTGSTTSGNNTVANPIADLLAERLAQQSQGISSSSSSNLQASIESAIRGTQRAGDMSREALQIERQREVGFAQDRASAQFTGALENRTGYGTQVQALKELTETTEKSVRDLDQRYREAMLQNDAATAQRVADLQVQKLEFLQAQEQNFYSNLLGVANLQQEALGMAQQNEQFMTAQAQQERQFQEGLTQSEYQFEQNYGLELQRIGLDEQQLDLQRQRNNISMAEYQLRKNELNKEKNFTNTEAIISQDIKNKMATGDWSEEEFMSTEYLAMVKANTGFDGSTEELSTVINSAFNSVKSAGAFNTPDTASATINRSSGFNSSLPFVIPRNTQGLPFTFDGTMS